MDSDVELLRRMERGDAEALSELYRRRQGMLFRFALHMSGSEAVAEDVVQETFLLLIRGAARYDESRGSVAGFLAGVARNLLRRAMAREGGPLGFDEEPELAGDEDLLASFTRQQDIDALREAVHALPPPYREVVVLCELEEMCYADAAGALGVPVGTVRSRLSRARQMLAERFWRRRAGRCPA